ncbi:MAG: 4Fe-4S dicluster domain-containing protein [Chloroflexi bacterium]|nr:4Fe-4S dicluster domain-containing protein [Chloroflexota bacterium]
MRQGLTIMTALEYCGYRLVRGCGCRTGACGACATVYNFKHDPELRYGLACQTAAEPDMCVVQIPFFPTAKPIYDIEQLRPTGEQILELYPELVTCFGCNNCTRSCPQGLEVMDFVSAALRGDFSSVVEKSFDCVMCGLCAARCPRGLPPHNVALLYRRLYARHLVPRSQHLEDRIKEIEEGKFEAEYKKLKDLPREELRRVYEERWIEPVK